jgi:FKBP-type peptidyl-prolyl cis-trans isomerase FklB
MEKISYALGLNIGNNLLGAGIKKMDLAKFIKAVEDAMESKEQEMSNETAQEILNSFFAELQEAKAETQVKKGALFLAENAKREGVITLPSGLQYEVMVAGSGATPTENQSVMCHYHGTLIDGTVFDSSVLRGQPATFGVGQVIKGWVEALQLMAVGSKWKLFIPSDLAYGAQGAGQHIGPYTTLIFEVELIDIV